MTNNDPHDQSGFTLVELVVVIILVSLLGTLAYTRVESIFVFKQKESLREFASTWEFLFQHSMARGETYRLQIDLDDNSYYVLRELPVALGEAVEVDYLANLRTKREQKRRKEEKLSEDAESEIEESRKTADLSELFFQMAFSDPGRSARLTKPPEFPELAEPKKFIEGLKISSIKTGSDPIDSGDAFIRFSPRGASQFAQIHFKIDEANYTLFMNPSSGKVSIEDSLIDHKWTYGEAKIEQ